MASIAHQQDEECLRSLYYAVDVAGSDADLVNSLAMVPGLMRRLPYSRRVWTAAASGLRRCLLPAAARRAAVFALHLRPMDAAVLDQAGQCAQALSLHQHALVLRTRMQALQQALEHAPSAAKPTSLEQDAFAQLDLDSIGDMRTSALGNDRLHTAIKCTLMEIALGQPIASHGPLLASIFLRSGLQMHALVAERATLVAENGSLHDVPTDMLLAKLDPYTALMPAEIKSAFQRLKSQ